MKIMIYFSSKGWYLKRWISEFLAVLYISCTSFWWDKWKCLQTKRGEIRIGYKKKCFYDKGNEEQEQWGGESSVPRDIQGEAGADPE